MTFFIAGLLIFLILNNVVPFLSKASWEAKQKKDKNANK